MRLETLKRRADFLKLRAGVRASSAGFALEAMARGAAEGGEANSARFGFTVTKKLGGAVVRNRIRRRLRAAVGQLAAEHARANFDYVLIARAPALDLPFDVLKKDLEQAFQRVHHPAGRRGRTT